MRSARLRFSPDFSWLNLRPSARRQKPVPIFESIPAIMSHATPLTFRSSRASIATATTKSGMTRLTNLQAACRMVSAAVHFSPSMVLLALAHRTKTTPRLSVGGTQNSIVPAAYPSMARGHRPRVVAIRSVRAWKSQIAHHAATVIAMTKRKSPRGAERFVSFAPSWPRRARRRK